MFLIAKKFSNQLESQHPKQKVLVWFLHIGFSHLLQTSGVFLSSFFGQSRHLHFLRLFDVEVEGGLDVSGAS